MKIQKITQHNGKEIDLESIAMSPAPQAEELSLRRSYPDDPWVQAADYGEM